MFITVTSFCDFTTEDAVLHIHILSRQTKSHTHMCKQTHTHNTHMLLWPRWFPSNHSTQDVCYLTHLGA